ncbi:nucleoside triphosphate pyrophosphohydrolase [Exilibacterium tricleocarpae]|uniref:Nucleoside triphosphate pyrophosphohydrolase n=2 Tax=Exilibacterium tricleocarpae TaxID=2591008 RepID=A0A545U4A9_9GAMM|nr:nucleoside triphosphate pyrophosphohydrolase [Exilibacterium tricleocarpae]
MSRLREPDTGCPWDLQQDYLSITPSTLEEAYEVVDAIEKADYAHLKEELGDLLFQVVFYSRLGQEDGYFSFPDIVSELVDKLVRRHPHVFPDGTLHSRVEQGTRDEEAIKANWEALKSEERAAKGKAGILDDVPLTLPALSRAAKLQKRAAGVGFDWADTAGVVGKIEEELAEVKAALAAGDSAAVAGELGDLLFATVNLSRHLKLDAEATLRSGNRKFERRFRYIEDKAREQGVNLESLSLETMDKWWDEAKEGVL